MFGGLKFVRSLQL